MPEREVRGSGFGRGNDFRFVFSGRRISYCK